MRGLGDLARSFWFDLPHTLRISQVNFDLAVLVQMHGNRVNERNIHIPRRGDACAKWVLGSILRRPESFHGIRRNAPSFASHWPAPWDARNHKTNTNVAYTYDTYTLFYYLVSLLISSFWTSCGLRCRHYSPPVRTCLKFLSGRSLHAQCDS